jgi:hypothetical protein
MIRPLTLLGLLWLAFGSSAARTADVRGTWRVTIKTSEDTITGKASLAQVDDKVSGWVGPSESDPIPVKGAVQGDKLTLKTYPQPGRTVAFDQCEVTVNGDKMAGTIDKDKGKIEFVRGPL